MTIRNAEKCIFIDRKKFLADRDNAITDAAVSLPPGKILVYEHGPYKGLEKELAKAVSKVAARLGLALVQWPNGPAADENRTWCYGLQKPSKGSAQSSPHWAR